MQFLGRLISGATLLFLLLAGSTLYGQTLRTTTFAVV